MKNKKIILILAAFALIFAVSCSSGGADGIGTTAEPQATLPSSTVPSESIPAVETTAETAAPTSNNDTLAVEFKDGLTIRLGAAAAEALAGCGEATEVLEAPSCVHPGTDRVYYFDGFSVTSSPDAAGNDLITAVEITGENAVLSNGVRIGSTADDVKAAFGEDFEDSFGMMTYDFDRGSLTVVCDSDSVVSIAFAITDY